MNILKLTKKENSPKKLFKMITSLKDFLKEEVDPNNLEWMENLKIILDFQDKNGSFNLINDTHIPSDARVDFQHMPTYICTAILMKTYLTTDSQLTQKIETPLRKGLRQSCRRNLKGHGYEALKGQIEALNIFMEAGLREFIDLHPDLTPKFTKMIQKITDQFLDYEKQEDFTGIWGENYKEDILKINKYFQTRQVFVYGTLMKDEYNHIFLQNSKYLNNATLQNYDMYNVGSYPAIIPGDDEIIGELYEVPIKDMPAIDRLEGEGCLYIKKCKTITEIPNRKTLAYIYEFMQDVEGLEKIKSWKDYVWYVAYGSNMLYDRFITYIQGGQYEEGGSYNYPCHDTSLPIKTKAIEIQYDMYFGNHSYSWQGCGVSFLDTTKKGKALSVAYLITREQFEHIAAEENGGRPPMDQGYWYENIITMGEIDGYKLITITNNELRPYNEPCKEYLQTLIKGIKENWPKMTQKEINNYIKRCTR